MAEYRVIRTAHNGTENREFRLSRPNGTDDYLLLYFKTPVIFTLFQNTQRILPGTCILLSPGTPNAFYPDGCDLVHDWMHFLPDSERSFEALKLPMNSFFTVEDLSFVSAAIRKCERELIFRDEHYEEMISSEVSTMFIRLSRLLNDKLWGEHAAAFRKLRMEIYREPKQYADTTEMAKKVGLSRSRFSVAYKECFGVPPKADLIAARVSKASYLLSMETPTLEEIAQQSGYQSIYHFIRQFRAVTGITPGKYRRNE